MESSPALRGIDSCHARFTVPLSWQLISLLACNKYCARFRLLKILTCIFEIIIGHYLIQKIYDNSMHKILILPATVFCHFSSPAQTTSVDDIEPYSYDTILKGGYTISFKTNDSLQYLYPVKASKRITELASCSRGLPCKNPGYVGVDFRDYFVLVHSFGSGNPHYIELIEKRSGENIHKPGSALIDINEAAGILLYC